MKMRFNLDMFNYVVHAKEAGDSDILPVMAIVGIVVGVVVLLISLVVLLVLLIRYGCKLNFISFFA